MKQELSFIKDFRPCIGFDGEIGDLEDEDLSNVEERSGVYIIVSPNTKFIYPKGLSKVIYIGEADNLKRRLKEHQKNLLNAIDDINNECWTFDRYNYMKYHGAKIYYFFCKGNQVSKDLESFIIRMFYDKYGATPVGNGARSFQ